MRRGSAASHARDPRALEILRRRQGDRRRLARFRRRLAHRRDRPERRGQEHILQPDHRRAEAGCRPDPARRRRYRRALAARDRAPRHRPRLPGGEHLSLADGAGDHAGRRLRRPAPRQRAAPAFPAWPRRATAPSMRWNCWGLPASATGPRRRCRMATRSCSISRSRWCSIQRCCCSTSRPPAWAPKSAGA